MVIKKLLNKNGVNGVTFILICLHAMPLLRMEENTTLLFRVMILWQTKYFTPIWDYLLLSFTISIPS